MKKKVLASFLILSVIFLSLLVMILPSYFQGDLSRASIQKEVQLPLLLNDKKDIALVLFGYAGCVDICTPRLSSLATYYKSLSPSIRKRVSVEFFDISIPINQDLPTQFASFFHPDFKGIFLPQKLLRKYTKAFDVYFSRTLMDTTQFNHSANLYLVQKKQGKKIIRYIYNSFPYDFKQIDLDLQGVLDE